MTSIVPKLLETCRREWEFFGRSVLNTDGTSKVGLREYEDGAWQRIGDYWRFIGSGYQHLTGKDRGTPWSAAFISWCMNESGAGTGFPYSAGHATYINAAIRQGQSGTAHAPLIAHAPKSYRLKPGDLIGYWRGEKRITIDNALSIGWYQSHTDIVVDVDGNKAYSIGGNVMHSVTKREVRLDAAGALSDKSQNWFVVIGNQL